MWFYLTDNDGHTDIPVTAVSSKMVQEKGKDEIPQSQNIVEDIY